MWIKRRAKLRRHFLILPLFDTLVLHGIWNWGWQTAKPCASSIPTSNIIVIRSVKITIPVCSCGIHRNGNEILLTWGLSCKSISFSWFQPTVNSAEDKSVVKVRFHAWTSTLRRRKAKYIIRPVTRRSCRITFWCLRGIVLFYPSVTSGVKRKPMWLLNVTCNVSVSTPFQYPLRKVRAENCRPRWFLASLGFAVRVRVYKYSPH